MTRPVQIAAVCFTDRTCVQVVGLTWRQALPFCREHGIPIAKCGRRSLVRLDRFLEAVDRIAGAEPREQYDEDSVVADAASDGGRR